MTTSITYPEFPINEYTHLERILKELQAIVQRENKRHQMDAHLTQSMLGLLEYEVIPMIENEMDCDPTPYELGEPPITADEMHTAAWNEHLAAHS
jgi:hypothetical protein